MDFRLGRNWTTVENRYLLLPNSGLRRDLWRRLRCLAGLNSPEARWWCTVRYVFLEISRETRELRLHASRDFDSLETTRPDKAADEGGSAAVRGFCEEDVMIRFTHSLGVSGPV